MEWLKAPDRFHGRSVDYQLMRCLACQLVWQKNPPSPVEMSIHYGENYDRFIGRAGESAKRWRGRRETILKYKSSGSLLDLGCSSGAFLETMKGPSWRLHGIEMSTVAAAQARERTGAEIFVGDILDAPFSPASFDVITCFDVLEHVYDPRKVIAQVQKWLRPGGIFYVLVPNIDSAEARLFRSYWYGLEMPRHLSHFSPGSLNRLAASVGLKTLSMVTGRNSALENSLRYLKDEAIRRVGVQLKPLAIANTPGVPWRAMRKVFRLTAAPVLLKLISTLGAGESIHAIFGDQQDAT